MSEQSKSEDQGVDSLDFDKRNVLYIIKGGKVRVLQLEMAVPNGIPRRCLLHRSVSNVHSYVSSLRL